METTILELAAPASRLLMDPADALADLKLDPAAYGARITRLVTRVSALMAAELLFTPAYRQVQEGFQQVQGRDLLLRGRPLNPQPDQAVLQVIHPAPPDDPNPDPPLVYQRDYTIRYTGRPSGEGSVFSAVGWPPSGEVWAGSGALGWWLGPETEDIDWQVTYWCGWWLPGMTGSRPAGVPTLPDDLVEACWLSVRKLWFEEQVDPNVQTIRTPAREVQFRRQLPTRGEVQAPQKALAHETVDALERYLPVIA